MLPIEIKVSPNKEVIVQFTWCMYDRATSLCGFRAACSVSALQETFSLLTSKAKVELDQGKEIFPIILWLIPKKNLCKANQSQNTS